MQDPADFDVDFPFLSIIATGAHTELLLTRGVGLHTILGFDVDIAIGRMLDRCANEVSKYCRHYIGIDFEGTDEVKPTAEQRQRLVEFCNEYNKQNS